MSDFKKILHDRLKQNPEPLYVFNDIITPAASLWVGVREWVNFFRKFEISNGDRIILSLDESKAFIQILFAALSENITVVLLRKEFFNEKYLDFFDAKICFSNLEFSNSILPNELGLPVSKEFEIRKTTKKYPQISLILKSSGSTGEPKFIALSEKNIISVLHSHEFIFSGGDVIAFSSLPWTHSFGLVLDLLLLTKKANLIYRDPNSGKNLNSIIENLDTYNVNHFSSVPILIEKILKLENGYQKLVNLDSGIIGGAPISQFISENLKFSKLRVGYGQSEAAPGIMLGDIGKFEENYLGRVVGTKVNVSNENVLEFNGDNKFLGYFENKELKQTEEGFFSTGDIVLKKGDEYFFKGRIDFSFKLPNGILFSPESLEKEILNMNKEIIAILVEYNIDFYIYYYSKTKLNLELPKFFQKFKTHLIPKEESDFKYTAKGELDRKKMKEDFSLS